MGPPAPGATGTVSLPQDSRACDNSGPAVILLRTSIFALLLASLLPRSSSAAEEVTERTASARGTEGTRPLPPAESLRALRTKFGLEVQLVAAEPLLESPVAIDWGADGKLWVCEMRDYPTGMDERWKPGGRIKVLRDTDGDGRFDQATVFLEDLPFPTGVTAWRRGALVCAAPDVLYAEDTDGDGPADKVEKLLSGFHTDNYQARVNSLSLGLDNWIYGANGLLGGTIRGTAGGAPVDIRNRDFRFKPGTTAFEPASGLTQQGRVRDDWGNWFGCDNSRALLHYPLPDHYLRRNPHVTAPAPIVVVPRGADANRLFPISRMLERFNDPHAANRVTSACGVGLYRDTLLGEDFHGNAFTCEPVHNVVHREVLIEGELTFTSRRADDERASEFLASTDNWFRPAQVRTGPDGALYVVDMYRFLIEHPRWIAAERLAKIDARAGANLGRIYRIVPKGRPLRPVRDLTKLSTADLAAALDSPNGTERDRVHLELLARGDKSGSDKLRALSRIARSAQVRVQSLCVLEGLGALRVEEVQAALADGDSRVQAHGVRLAETFLRAPAAPGTAALSSSIEKLARDPDHKVRAQLAFSLGEWEAPAAAAILGRLATRHLDEPRFRAAVLSSASRHWKEILPAVFRAPQDAAGRDDWIAPLVSTAVGSGDEETFTATLVAMLPRPGQPIGRFHFILLASTLDALGRKQETIETLQSRHTGLREAAPRLDDIFNTARRLAADESAPRTEREPAIGLLGRRPNALAEDIHALTTLVQAAPESLRKAAFTALRRLRELEVADSFLRDWPRYSPARRAEILPLLLGREEWSRPLLEAVRRGVVQRSEIAPADRERLAGSQNTALRQLATSVFPPVEKSSRAEALAKFEGALQLTGNATRGADGFVRACASCHALGGQGHAVGPDLAPLRGKPADYWLKNILDPNAVVEPRFVNYQVETKDGRSLSGVIQAETATGLTLVSGGGATETVLRTEVGEIRASELSLMPEGLEEGFTLQAMADLIAFVRANR